MMYARSGNLPMALLRFFLVLFINPWGRVILGILVFSGGLVWGLFSHQVSYVQGGHGPYQAYLTEDNGFVIFQQESTNNYFVMPIQDYSPEVDTATILVGIICWRIVRDMHEIIVIGAFLLEYDKTIILG